MRAASPPPTEGVVLDAPRSESREQPARTSIHPRNRRTPLSAQEPVLRRLAAEASRPDFERFGRPGTLNEGSLEPRSDSGAEA